MIEGYLIQVEDLLGENPNSIEATVELIRRIRAVEKAIDEQAEQAETPFLVRAAEAAAPYAEASRKLDVRTETLKRKVSEWQEEQRRANPFADPKDASQVRVEGKVLATVQVKTTYEVFKPDLVPREFCSPDRYKIGAHVDGDHGEIPGVRQFKKITSKVL